MPPQLRSTPWPCATRCTRPDQNCPPAARAISHPSPWPTVAALVIVRHRPATEARPDRCRGCAGHRRVGRRFGPCPRRRDCHPSASCSTPLRAAHRWKHPQPAPCAPSTSRRCTNTSDRHAQTSMSRSCRWQPVTEARSSATSPFDTTPNHARENAAADQRPSRPRLCIAANDHEPRPRVPQRISGSAPPGASASRPRSLCGSSRRTSPALQPDHAGWPNWPRAPPLRKPSSPKSPATQPLDAHRTPVNYEMPRAHSQPQSRQRCRRHLCAGVVKSNP